MTSRLRVLSVIASADLGGAEIHLLDILRRLPADHTVVALADGPMLARYEQAGARVVLIPAPGKMPLAAAGAIDRLLRAERPHLIHTHTPKANLLGAMLRTSVPRVLTIHGGHRQFAASRLIPAAWYLWADLWAAARAARIIAVCEADRDELVRAGFAASRTVTIPNGIPDPRRGDEPLSAGDDIVWIGRFSAEKAPEEMNEIARLLDGFPLPGRIRMIGDGPLRRDLERRRAPGVECEGPYPDLEPVWNAAGLLVNTSLSEGTSYTILEAMARGVPVVASAVGGTPELLGEAGRLVPLGLAPAERRSRFAAAIRGLFENDASRAESARQGRRRFEEYFRIETMIAALERLYRAIAAPDDGFLEASR